MSEDTATDTGEEHEEHPKGTMLIVFLMILLMAALWGWAYYLLVLRSG